MDVSKTVWYHGSPEELTYIRAGSSITPTENVARGFSYKPRFLEVNNEGRSIRHSGKTGGYLYVVDEVLTEADITMESNPANEMWFEWLVNRPVRVRLLRRTTIEDSERFSSEEIERMLEMQKQNGNKNSLTMTEE